MMIFSEDEWRIMIVEGGLFALGFPSLFCLPFAGYHRESQPPVHQGLL